MRGWTIARLFDRMFTQDIQAPSWLRDQSLYRRDDITRTTRDALAQAQVIVVDNVSEAFYALDTREYWYLNRDFPGIAPPFGLFWVEFQRPTCTRSRVAGTISGDSLPRCTGVLFTVFGPEGPTNIPEDLWVGSGLEKIIGLNGTKWMYYASAFQEFDDRCLRFHARNGTGFMYATQGIVGPVASWWIALDKMGDVIEGVCEVLLPDHVTSDQKKRIDRAVMPIAYPAFLALSLMNCKNTVVHDETPPLKLNQSRVKQGKRPFASYKILEVKPLDQVIRRSKQLGPHEVVKSRFHIRRGYLADYRQGNGLFGRHKGVYWFPASYRGDVGEGSVEKVYNPRTTPDVQKKLTGKDIPTRLHTLSST